MKPASPCSLAKASAEERQSRLTQSVIDRTRVRQMSRDNLAYRESIRPAANLRISGANATSVYLNRAVMCLPVPNPRVLQLSLMNSCREGPASIVFRGGVCRNGAEARTSVFGRIFSNVLSCSELYGEHQSGPGIAQPHAVNTRVELGPVVA